MSSYSETELQLVREALEQQRQVLTEHIRAGLSESEQNQFAAILGRSAGDSSDEALASSLADLSAARLNLEVRQWRELDAAAGRMASPGFGVCQDCDAAIPLARMVANPAAVRCIACQEAHEKTHASQPHGSL
ncbi:MAG: TraR/DksA family transcriptional regulator [Parasulfuritortus sp.]|nr:TraR/DksA family transcriptional regulator [Parasulfuritortus sp.]